MRQALWVGIFLQGVHNSFYMNQHPSINVWNGREILCISERMVGYEIPPCPSCGEVKL